MKKIIKAFAVFLCTVIVLNIVACTKDAEDLIVGKWNVESVTFTDVYTNHPDPSINGTHTETENVPEGYSMTFTFKKDKTVEIVQGRGDESLTMSGTYTVDGMKLTITATESYTDDNGQIHNYTNTEMFEIASIDKEKMTLRITERDSDDVYDGTTYHYLAYSDYNMKRI